MMHCPMQENPYAPSKKHAGSISISSLFKKDHRSLSLSTSRTTITITIYLHYTMIYFKFKTQVLTFAVGLLGQRAYAHADANVSPKIAPSSRSYPFCPMSSQFYPSHSNSTFQSDPSWIPRFLQQQVCPQPQSCAGCVNNGDCQIGGECTPSCRTDGFCMCGTCKTDAECGDEPKCDTTAIYDADRDSGQGGDDNCCTSNCSYEKDVKNPPGTIYLRPSDCITCKYLFVMFNAKGQGNNACGPFVLGPDLNGTTKAFGNQYAFVISPGVGAKGGDGFVECTPKNLNPEVKGK